MSIHPDALAAKVSRAIDLSNDRLETLMVLIQGVINARTVNLTHLAGTFYGPAKLSSNYRRLQRFFQYVRLDGDWLARMLVTLLRLRPPYRLCLNRTNWKVGRKDVNLLGSGHAFRCCGTFSTMAAARTRSSVRRFWSAS